MSSEETVTVTIPAALAREYCERVYREQTPASRMRDVLADQLPREIEEGCRVKCNTMNSAVGTCGKPFMGEVLVKWDNAKTLTAWPLEMLVRID